MRIRVLLAVSPRVNERLATLLDGEPDMEVLGKIAAEGPGEGGTEDNWRVQLLLWVHKLSQNQRPPDVVVVASTPDGNVLGICQQLLDLCPSLVVLAVPPGEKDERVGFVFRRSTTVEEVLARPWENVLRVIRAACPDDGIC